MKKIAKLCFGAVFASLILLLAFLSFNGYKYSAGPPEIVGRTTFTQTMTEADGNEVSFFASGDERFNYLHDKDGYILLRDNGYLVYAVNRDGRPVPTRVRYADSPGAIASMQRMVYSELNFSANPDLLTDYPLNASYAPYAYDSGEVRHVANLVIYICFEGESINLDGARIDNLLNGPSNSLSDYYQKLSNGKIIVHNLNPYTAGGDIFIYKDPMPRSYYQLKYKSASRTSKERTLLNNAVTASRQYFDFGEYDLDADGDGYIDAVNFLISGSPYSEWGGMLWPHSWNLDDISNGNPATIGGIKVKNYSFNFLEQLTVGLLAHEFAHVLGVPDLYHYDDSHVAVGNWDLMHFEADLPQYMTTHLRYKYLNVIQESQIGVIDYNGIYALKPVTSAKQDDIVAYRINTDNPNEYFMVEYRNNNVTGYDSSLPGSGLIIYRIRRGVTGNANAKKNDKNHPDELYIFRPRAVTTGTEAANSLANLNKAYLSPLNTAFSSLGFSLNAKPGGSYDPTTIYYTDGKNSGIVINSRDIGDGEIIFEVKLSDESLVDDDYFVNKFTLSNVKLINSQQFSGVYADLTVSSISLSNLDNLIILLKTEDNRQTASLELDKSRFATSYGQGLRSFSVRFVINDKGNGNLSTVFYNNDWKSFDKPTKMELYVIDTDKDMVALGGWSIDDSEVSWEAVQLTNLIFKPSLSASLKTTIAVRGDGKALISSGLELPSEVSDVLSASAGSFHILLLKSNLKVAFYGNSNHNENDVQSWQNIIKVAAGQYTSYGLDLAGNVFRAGDQAAEVASWSDIIDIAAGYDHVAGLKANGEVVAAGAGGEALAVGTWKDVAAIACGNGYTAGLKKDGTVYVAGNLLNKEQLQGMRNIKKIAAGEEHLLLLNKDGRVFAVGKNLEGNCEVGQYFDIIDIAAGLYQSVLLREDGKPLYAGANTNLTNNVSSNLIYYNNDYVPVSSLLAPFTEKIMKTGETYQLNPLVLPKSATYKKITYKSSDKTVAEVSEDGLITAYTPGSVVIDATHRGSDLTVGITITVIAPYQSTPMAAAGDAHSVILDHRGTVTASGSDSSGQLDVNMWGNIKFIAAGGDTTVGVTPDGRVLSAGELQADVSAWTDIVYVSVSGRTIVGISGSGKVFAAGDDSYQQVTKVNGRLSVLTAAASPTHIVLVNQSGEVEAYGNNNRGQLNVSNWRKVVQIAAQEGFTLGLCEDGTLLYAGCLSYIEDMSVLSEWYDIVAISAGRNHIAAIDCNGKVYAVGNNSFLQCDVQGMTQMGRIAAGGEHTVGIKFDGSAVGAGRNNDGRLVLPSTGPLPVVPLISVGFANATFGVKVGQTKRLTLVFSPYNATDRKNENITYSSQLENIAEVDGDGFIRGKSAGQTTITIAVRKSDGSQYTATIAVYVYSSVHSLSWVSPPTKTAYGYNEKLDLLGGKIEVTLDDNKRFFTDVTPAMVQNYGSATSELGTKSVIISEGGKTLEYNITVINTVKDVIISNTAQLKTSYDYGDPIDLTGGWIQITRSHGEVETLAMEELKNREALEVIANTNILATTSVTLEYTDKAALTAGISNVFYLSYQITVFDAVIDLTAQLDKTSFRFGEEIFGNGKLILNMKSGVNIEEPLIKKLDIEEGVDSVITISNYDKYMLGEQRIRINYQNPDFDIRSELFPEAVISVDDTIAAVEITSMTLNDAAVYDKTKSLDSSITVRVTFAGGAVVDVGYEGETPLFNDNIKLEFGMVSGEDREGFATTSLKIMVLERIGAGMQHTQQHHNNSLKVLGLGNIASLSFEGGNEFLYGQSTDLKLIIATGAESYEILIDDARLGIDNKRLMPQTVSFTLLGITATKQILFKDYVVGIYPQHISVEAVLNMDLQLTVYRIMASGDEQPITDGWFSDYNREREGLQSVTVRYQNFTYLITVNVLNAIKEASVVSTPQTTYQIHEDINLSAFSIKITFVKGNFDIVAYSPDKFTAVGYDKNIIGIQIVTITYNLTGDSWEYAFEVQNKIKRIEIDYSLSKTVYTVNDDLDLTLICVYENGDRTTVSDSWTSNFDKTLIGAVQTVNIVYWGRYSTAIKVEIIDAPREITIKAPAKKYYEYGELLNLEGGVLTIITQTGARKTEPLTAYRNYLSSFNPTPLVKGAQQLTLTIPQYNVSAGFIVYVKEKASSVLLEKKEDAAIKIDRTNTRILLEDSATLATFHSMVSSYVDIRYKSGNSYLDLSTSQDVLISSNIKVEIRNGEDTLLEMFSVFIKGDANGDGVFDENDLRPLGQALLLGSESAAFYADYNGDRAYTLTDFVNWVQEAEQKIGRAEQ